MNKDGRICIIGGGPAGIAAAMYLQVKGYKNVEIFEREMSVGGKARGPWELYGGDSYFALRELEYFGESGHALTFADLRAYRDKGGAETTPYGRDRRRAASALKLTGQTRKLERLLETKYKGFACYGHVGISKGAFFGLSKEMENHLHRVRGKNRFLRDLVLPFDQFCRINGVEEAAGLWTAPLSAAGCGFPDELPAAYVLKRFDLRAVLDFHDETYWEWEEGAKSIFEAVNQRLDRPANLGTEVVRVTRTEDAVRVTVRGETGEREERFDRLIVAAPLPAFAAYADVSAEEKELFGKIRYKKAAQFLAHLSPNIAAERAGFIPENFAPEGLGHLAAWQRSDAPFWEEETVAAVAYLSHEGSRPASAGEAFTNMEAELGLFGLEASEGISEKVISGMPFVPCPDYADGWYDRLEALQGQRGTYYSGEILSAGSLEDACAASRDLVGRFF